MDTIRIFGQHDLAADTENVILDRGVPAEEVWEPNFIAVHRESGRGALRVRVEYSPAENTDVTFPISEFEVDQTYLRQESHTIWGPGDRVRITMTPSDPMSVSFVVMGVKHEWRSASIPSAWATGATAGKPGDWTPSGSTAPQDIHALKADDPVKVTATPVAAWETGEYVVCKGGANAYWDGAAWSGGKA